MRRIRRSRRSKVKVTLDNKNGEVAEIGKSCDGPKEEAVVDEEDTKTHQGEMHYHDPSTHSRNRRTRRSRRSKAKIFLVKKEEVVGAATKELIADSSEGVTGSAVASAKSCDDFKEEKVSVVEKI